MLDLIPYWQLTYDPQLWSTTNKSLGVLAKYRRDLAPLRARLIVGADVDWSPGSFTADRVIATREGPNQVFASYTTGERQYDYDVTYRAVSTFAGYSTFTLHADPLGARWMVLRYVPSAFT